MILKPAPVPTGRFTYDTDANLLVAEASDLPPFERVWDDACDVGLTLISARTGREVVVAVDHTERDGEGDTLYWDLVPADRGETGLIKARVFND